jgi:hypothetical protein
MSYYHMYLLITSINRGIFATGPSGVIPIAVLKEESTIVEILVGCI